jgi:tyrosyl-tRNA synthetase
MPIQFENILQQNPEKRIAQHKLADEVTELVHGRMFNIPIIQDTLNIF